MRKAIVSILALGLIAAAFSAAPAVAKKKKKTVTVHKEISAGPHLSFPGEAAAGCADGQETINKTTVPFTTPGKGILTVEIGEFQGDWDLYVFEAGNIIAAAESDQTTGGAPATEKIMINLGAKKNIEIVACPWAGGPTATGHFMYKYKK